MYFSELDLIWKIMVVIGIISFILFGTLLILVILIFKTDVVPYTMLFEDEPDISNYDYLFEPNPVESAVDEPLIDDRLITEEIGDIDVQSQSDNL
jgi:hypothetical protein